MDITGASAVISGGGGGFGAATTKRLVEAGAHVVIADADETKGSSLAAELGDGATFVRTDVTSEDSVKAAIAVALEHGPLRVAVSAHGGPAAAARVLDKHGEPMAQATFDRTIAVFLGGTFNMLRLTSAAMAKQDALESGVRGVVINTASIAAYEGQVGQADYAAAKAGVVGLTLVSARDLSPLGIRVMTIAPGTFFTPAFGMAEEDAQARWGAAVPFPKRMGRAQEYAALVASIVDNDYLNGETIRIDGAQRFGLK